MIRDSWTRSGLPIHLLWQIWSLTGIPNGKRELEVRLADPGHRVRLGTRDGGEINGQAAVRRVRVRALRARRMVDRLLHRPSFLPSFLSVASNADRAAAAAGYLPTAEVTKAPKPAAETGEDVGRVVTALRCGRLGPRCPEENYGYTIG